jgi:hypothetical protein
MKHDEFLKLLEVKVHKNNVLLPSQQETQEWLDTKKDNEIIYFQEVKARDLSLHKAYFLILSFIYDRLNVKFKKNIPKKSFYQFLKMISNEYNVIFKFKDGREFIEWKSISFSKMNQNEFKLYFNNQLTVIYEEILIPFEQDYLMDEINVEFEKILNKLI